MSAGSLCVDLGRVTVFAAAVTGAAFAAGAFHPEQPEPGRLIWVIWHPASVSLSPSCRPFRQLPARQVSTVRP